MIKLKKALFHFESKSKGTLKKTQNRSRDCADLMAKKEDCEPICRYKH